jgi:hypothetical protein
VSNSQPEEPNVDHGEVHRREQQDVEPVGPGKGSFSIMTGLMIAVVVFAAVWIIVTQVL